VSNTPEITEVRAEHVLDEQRLSKYLLAKLDGCGDDLAIRQFEGGQSNPTYLLESGGKRWVLRKKPPGQLLKSAHAVEREYKVMKALQDSEVPVPRMDLLCEDDSVIGTPFFVMEWVDGQIIMSPLESSVAADELNAIFRDYMRILGCLHNVDYEAVGLGRFGRPGNYFARQISRWSQQYRASETDPIADMDRLIEWLPRNIPEDDASTIVHGDFTIRNMVIANNEPRVLAVLDWELSTIGHPMGDLAYTCQFYHHSGHSREQIRAKGIPDEQELIDIYCRQTGSTAVSDWSFYIAYCKFRLAAISQGVYKRGLDGNASSQAALQFHAIAENWAKAGWAVVETG
jgi:aminoglycoside phosphotransferase (APT) family kinase protein